MNKIYKIVWNAAQEAWVAVSELAKGHVKASSSGKNAKQSTVVEEEGSTSFTLYSLGKAAYLVKELHFIILLLVVLQPSVRISNQAIQQFQTP